MKICVVGAGALGGYVGGRLGLAGHQMSLIARGAHLEAIRKQGLTLIEKGRERVLRDVWAGDCIAEAGEQDVVLLCLKVHQVASVVSEIPALFGPHTVLVPMQNGIPWWYFQGIEGPHRDRIVEAVDAGGVIASAMDYHRIVGCITYAAAEMVRPGVIRHIQGERFPVGEPDGGDSARVRKVSEMMCSAGFQSPVLPDIRSGVWLKLWGNLSFNPVSALTRGTLADICHFPPARALTAAMMAEARTIGESFGAQFDLSIERRLEDAERVGAHRTSMLQDVTAGKELEIKGILGAVIELGELSGAEMPALKAVYACTSLLNEVMRARNVRICEEPLLASPDADVD